MKIKISKSFIILLFLICLQNCAKKQTNSSQNSELLNVSNRQEIANANNGNKIRQSIENAAENQTRKPTKVKGIEISFDLIAYRSDSERERLVKLVEESLEKNQVSLIELIDYDCGGGAGCYDLGSVMVQIIYRIGEKNAVKIFSDMTSVKANRLSFLIRAGLEYGDNNYDGKMDNKLIESEFPELYTLLARLNKCEDCQ